MRGWLDNIISTRRKQQLSHYPFVFYLTRQSSTCSHDGSQHQPSSSFTGSASSFAGHCQRLYRQPRGVVRLVCLCGVYHLFCAFVFSRQRPHYAIAQLGRHLCAGLSHAHCRRMVVWQHCRPQRPQIRHDAIGAADVGRLAHHRADSHVCIQSAWPHRCCLRWRGCCKD